MKFKQDYRNAGNSAGKQEIVNNHWLKFYGYLVENKSDSPVFIQLFDASSSDDVILGTTPPNWTMEIPADSKFGITPDSLIMQFNKGLTYAITTTRDGGELPTNDVFVTIWYWDIE